jgi:energy-converting hydrogenase Eha subunit E
MVAVLSFALMRAIRARVVAAALSVVFGSVGAAQAPSVSPPSKRMLDGKH